VKVRHLRQVHLQANHLALAHLLLPLSLRVRALVPARLSHLALVQARVRQSLLVLRLALVKAHRHHPVHLQVNRLVLVQVRVRLSHPVSLHRQGCLNLQVLRRPYRQVRVPAKVRRHRLAQALAKAHRNLRVLHQALVLVLRLHLVPARLNLQVLRLRLFNMT